MKGFALMMKNNTYDWFVSSIHLDKAELKRIVEDNKEKDWAKLINLRQKIVECRVHFKKNSIKGVKK